jgi:hypothetical protein
MRFPIIAHSGANFHVFHDSAFFDFITPMSGKVILGDGKTSLDVKGVGTIKLQFGQDILTVENVRHVPSLAESIYSLLFHIQRPGYTLNSSFDDGLSIVFPTFQTTAIIGHDDIYLNVTPVNLHPFPWIKRVLVQILILLHYLQICVIMLHSFKIRSHQN